MSEHDRPTSRQLGWLVYVWILTCQTKHKHLLVKTNLGSVNFSNSGTLFDQPVNNNWFVICKPINLEYIVKIMGGDLSIIHYTSKRVKIFFRFFQLGYK